MTNETEEQYDASVIGVEVAVGSFTITEEHIRDFCEAVGETNPLYLDAESARTGPYGGIVAPPSFYTAVQAKLKPGLDPKVKYGNSTFNAGQHCEFLQPIRPGDTVSVSSSVHEIYEKTGRTGRMLFVVRRLAFRNQQHEDLTVIDASQVFRTIDRG